MKWQNLKRSICFFNAAIHIGVVQIAYAQGASIEPVRILAIEDRAAQKQALGDALKARFPNEQIELLKEVFRLDLSGDATPAMRMLIQRSALDGPTLELAADRVQNWNIGQQSILLSDLYNHRALIGLPADAVAPFQRLLLAAHESALAPGAPDEPAEFARYRRQALCYSLALLSELPGAPAVELARIALQIVPDANAAWIVLIQRAAVDEAAINLAQQLFADDARPLPIRYLAAIALAPTHPEARQFTLDTVNAAIAEHGGLTMEEMLLPHLKLPSGHPDRARYYHFMDEVIPVISYIQLLNPEDSEPLLRRCAAARQEQISGAAHVMLAMRFPEMVLEDPPLLNDPDAMLSIAAYVAEEHPRLLPVLEIRYGAAAIDAAIQTVRANAIIDWRIRPWPLPK